MSWSKDAVLKVRKFESFPSDVFYCALVTSDSQRVFGPGDNVDTLVFKAFEVLVKNHEGVALNVWSNATRLKESVDFLREGNLFQNVEVFSSRSSLVPTEMSAVAESLLSALEPPKVHRVKVATDGSFSRRSRVGGWAAVDEYGNFHVGSGRVSGPEQAELEALLLSMKLGSKLIVVSDCANVVGKLKRKRMVSSKGKRLVKATQQRAFLDRLESHDVTVSWVKGHNGNVLNELANDLAVASRRCTEANMGFSQTREMCAKVVERFKIEGHVFNS